MSFELTMVLVAAIAFAVARATTYFFKWMEDGNGKDPRP